MNASADGKMRYLAVGRIVGIHGIRGEVKVELLTENVMRFQPGLDLYLGSEERNRRVSIVSSRSYRSGRLLLLSGVSDRDAAERLRGQYLLINESDASPLGEHENYVHDLIGLTVRTTDGHELGVITDVLSTAANDIYVVANNSGELLIPALRSVVVAVDLAEGTMDVTLPEGLVDHAGDTG